MLPLAAMPRPPCRPAARSVMMSPNMLLVTMTSNWRGSRTICMQMVRDPRQFDVIVTNNMFGDIITDLAAGLQGGLGMAASGNIHPGKTSMFEPVHGSAPLIAGRNTANPFGAILTTAMMLAHLGMEAESVKIEGAVLEAVRQKKTTQDIGGPLGTREAGE